MALHEKVHAECRWWGHTSSRPGPEDVHGWNLAVLGVAC